MSKVSLTLPFSHYVWLASDIPFFFFPLVISLCTYFLYQIKSCIPLSTVKYPFIYPVLKMSFLSHVRYVGHIWFGHTHKQRNHILAAVVTQTIGK